MEVGADFTRKEEKQQISHFSRIDAGGEVELHNGKGFIQAQRKSKRLESAVD